MLIMTTQGLYCQRGNFYIDPKRGVENAVITHAHSDHARRGSQTYYCVNSGISLLKSRIGKKISVNGFPYQQQFQLGDTRISFHPAGHILGSSQVRIEAMGEVWVVSGDYKRDFDPTCEPFEAVPCDVFITEATFGTPAYKWRKDYEVGKDIFDWWTENAEQGYNSVVCAYSLGKTQRILGLLKQYTTAEIYCHKAAAELNDCYRNEGIELAPTICLSQIKDGEVLTGKLVIAPMAFLSSDDISVLGKKYKTAFASGWMARDSFGFDRGFLLSDHADWNDLLQTVAETKAKKVFVQHRKGALIRQLRARGIKAFHDSALYPKNPDQLAFF
jgi:putative mRNA 3-end processing factor